MSSFNRSDYKKLFQMGRELYEENSGNSQVREIATQLMAMSESAIGQQVPWPNIHKRYRHLTTYPEISTAELYTFSSCPVPFIQK